MDDFTALKQAFIRYRGTRKHVHYTPELWERAKPFLDIYPLKVIARELEVSLSSVKRHLKNAQQTSLDDPSFIQLGSMLGVGAGVRALISLQTSFISSIEFHGSAEELAIFITSIKGS